jgi:hypothetical protein
VYPYKIDRHFDRHRDRIRREHEALERLMSPGVVSYSLQYQAGNAGGQVLLLRDLAQFTT